MPKAHKKNQNHRSRQRVERLINEGSTLLENRKSLAACRKFTEALSLKVDDDDLNAIIYTNRSACRAVSRQYQGAATDAIQVCFRSIIPGSGAQLRHNLPSTLLIDKATILSPDYPKAWARLGIAKDYLKEPWDSITAWQNALKYLPKDNIMAPDETLDKKIYEVNLQCALKVWHDSRYLACSQIEGNGSGALAMPWIVARGMMPELENEGNFESSAWIIAKAYDDFERANLEMVPVMSEEGVPFFRTQVLRTLTNAILTDSRAFEPEDPCQWLEQFERQAEYEMRSRRIWHWRDLGLNDMLEEAEFRLSTEGWEQLRPALSTIICYWVLRGFLDGSFLDDNFHSEATYLNRALGAIEKGQRVWGHLMHHESIRVLEDSFLRGVQRLYIDALLNRYVSETSRSKREKLLDETEAECEALINNVCDYEPLPSHDESPAFTAAFYYHVRGHAYAAQAYCAAKRIDDHNHCTPLEIMKGYQKAAYSFLQAVNDFSADDIHYCIYLCSAIQHMLPGASRARDLLKYMERLRLALVKMEKIWGTWVSRRGESHKSRFEGILEVETTLRKHLLEGEVKEDQTICVDEGLVTELGPSSFLLKL
ncbi:hypothetical protein PQX77_001726 [Marasmius sp. AFHP31]|nr:hypothetical protein PQX77_001726 [Marasmius sp. AFHP31]